MLKIWFYLLNVPLGQHKLAMLIRKIHAVIK